MTRIVPNSFQKPNLYTDKLMRFLTGDEWKTLDYALRRTFGFNKDADRISVSQFMNGNGRLDDVGRPLEYGTGLSREAQIRALNELMRFGILIERAPNNALNHGRLWVLQLDESLVRFDLILARAESQYERDQKRTEKARQAQATGRSAAQTGSGQSDRPAWVVSVADRYWSVRQTSTGQCSRPGAVSQTDPQKHSKKPRRNPGETQSPEGDGAAPVIEGWLALVRLCNGAEARAEAVLRLQKRFADMTQLKQPDARTDRGREKLLQEWWPYLLQVLAEADDDLATAEAAIQEAFRSMTQRETPLNVVGPRSIVKVAAGVIAGRRRGASTGAGLQQRPKGLTGIDAYVERRGMKHGN